METACPNCHEWYQSGTDMTAKGYQASAAGPGQRVCPRCQFDFYRPIGQGGFGCSAVGSPMVWWPA